MLDLSPFISLSFFFESSLLPVSAGINDRNFEFACSVVLDSVFFLHAFLDFGYFVVPVTVWGHMLFAWAQF